MVEIEAINFISKVKDIESPNGTVKPWGREIKWADVKGKYTGKILYIKSGQKLSKQYHKSKVESMMVLFGTLYIEYGDKLLTLRAGDTIDIDANTIHRPMAIGGDVTILEISTWDDGDVVRLEDKYGRSCATV